jgi:hydrogenase maturation factor HypF (carbamoyltransferase family)
MNTFSMTCSHCDKTFKIHDGNRHLWAKGACDTCSLRLSLDPQAKFSVRITAKGLAALEGDR